MSDYVPPILNIVIDVVIVWLGVACVSTKLPSWVNRFFEQEAYSKAAGKWFIKVALLLFVLHAVSDLGLEAFMILHRVHSGMPLLSWSPGMFIVGDVFAVFFLETWFVVLQGQLTHSSIYRVVCACAFVVTIDLFIHQCSFRGLGVYCQAGAGERLPSVVLNTVLLVSAIVAVTLRYGRESIWFSRAFASYSLAKVPAYLQIPGADSFIYLFLGPLELLAFILFCLLLLNGSEKVKTRSLLTLGTKEPWELLWPREHRVAVIAAVFIVVFQVAVVCAVVNPSLLFRNHELPVPYPWMKSLTYLSFGVYLVAVFLLVRPMSIKTIDQLLGDPEFWVRFIRKVVSLPGGERRLWDFKESFSFWKDSHKARLKLNFAIQVAALANADGGVLIVGIENETWNIVGIPKLPDRYQEDANKIVQSRVSTFGGVPFTDISYMPVWVPNAVSGDGGQQARSKLCLVVIVGRAAKPVTVNVGRGRYILRVRRGAENSPVSPSELYETKRTNRGAHDFIRELEKVIDDNSKRGDSPNEADEGHVCGVSVGS